MNLVFLFFTFISLIFVFRLAKGQDCYTNETDTVSIEIQQLREAINTEECQLAKDTTYIDYSPTDFEEFDFIVVGAGAAGSVVGNRLSEITSWRVLVLEAGGSPSVATEIPGFVEKISSDLFWPYVAEPEPFSCQGNKNKTCYFTTGKALGGGSTVNGLGYVRGHPYDYDNWQKMGNPKWGYKYMLPYFKKSEDMRSTDLSNPLFFKYHGRGGLLKIELFNSTFKSLRNTINEGFESLGYKSHNDVNAQFHEGTFPYYGILENGRRCSTAKAFLHDFQRRSNLKISINSLVTKVLIDENKVAYGVTFIKNGKLFSVKASKEVILSAGVVRSPQLLMISGIGPRKHLQEVGIEVIQDLRVGYNLHDHVQFLGFPVSIDTSLPSSNPLENIFEYLVEHRGDLAEMPLSFTAFLQTSQEFFPNIQMFVCYLYPNSTKITAQQKYISGLDENILNSIRKITSSKPALLLDPILLRPKSRGRVLLKSTDPQDYPLIFPGLLSKDRDVEELLEVIALLNRLVQTPPFKSMKAEVQQINIPGCDAFVFQSEAYWRCVIKYMSFTYLHAVGTCKMGTEGNKDSVVNPTLQVIGIKHLRVVDGSIMPNVTSGNTMAPIIAIAEKASDLIKLTWSQL